MNSVIPFSLKGVVRGMSAGALCCMLALGLDSCGGHKQNVNVDRTYEPVERSLSGGSYADRFAAILQADDQWTRVKLPVTLGVENPGRFSVTGTAQIERGESVFVSFRMLGFEVAQLYVTDERVMLIDKYHRKYVEEPTSTLLKGVDISIDDVQSLLLGQPFVAGSGNRGVSRAVESFTFEEVDNSWDASSATDVGVEYGFLFNEQNNLEVFSAGLVNTVPFFVCEYSSAVSHGESLFASASQFTVRTGDDPAKNIIGSVSWNFDKASWDDDVTPRKVTSPSGYEKVSVEDLLKLFVK